MVYIFVGLKKTLRISLVLTFGKQEQQWNVKNSFKCLKCARTDDNSDKMREHIEAKHKLDKASKCNFCDHEDKTWLGLKNHYKLNHINKY